MKDTSFCALVRLLLTKLNQYLNIYVLTKHVFMTSYFIPFQTQTILSLLGEVDAIHIIASIDHINAPLSEYHVLVIQYPYNKLNTCWLFYGFCMKYWRIFPKKFEIFWYTASLAFHKFFVTHMVKLYSTLRSLLKSLTRQLKGKNSRF